MIKVWTASLNNNGYDINSFILNSVLDSHEDAVTQVIWKPSNENYNIIASTGEVNYIYYF